MQLLSNLMLRLGLCLLWLLHLAPLRLLSALGVVCGELAYFLARKRRNIGIKNLTLCFPQMSLAAKKRLIRQHFRYLAISALEYSIVFYGSAKQIKDLVKIDGIDYLKQYYGNKQIILLLPHFTGLDLAAIRLSLDFIGDSLYSRQKSEFLTDCLKKARLRFIPSGILFSRQDGLRPVLRRLKSATKHIFYYLPDQDFGENDSIYVPFFAHENCATITALPKLVKLSEAVLIVMAVYRLNGQYHLKIYPPISDYPSGDLRADIIKMNQLIENTIKLAPAQYFWLHKRFKSQPGLARGAIYNENCDSNAKWV